MTSTSILFVYQLCQVRASCSCETNSWKHSFTYILIDLDEDFHTSVTEIDLFSSLFVFPWQTPTILWGILSFKDHSLHAVRKENIKQQFLYHTWSDLGNYNTELKRAIPYIFGRKESVTIFWKHLLMIVIGSANNEDAVLAAKKTDGCKGKANTSYARMTWWMVIQKEMLILEQRNNLTL